MSETALPATESASPRYAAIETWPPAAILDALLENQLAAAAAVRPALPAIEAAAAAALPRLQAGGRLAYAGAGTSARIATQDGAELPPTFDWPRDRLLFLVAGGPAALIEAAEGAEDATPATSLGPNDTLIALAASGATPFTLAALHQARAAGALTIALANTPSAPLLAAAHHPILLQTGPEPIAGSTRLGAGTAQKIALNLLSTLLMTRLGRVHRGHMVDMRATNAKLRRRATRMLCTLAPTTPEHAEHALHQADGHLKLALLLLRGYDRPTAESALAAASGNLHAIPQAPP